MNTYLKHDEWRIIEDNFIPENTRASESIFSIGNGAMGQRANFEEKYSGNSLQGSYIGGVYYPDKTRVGWWKNGYPEYFAKVINSTNWIGISVKVNGEELDLATAKVLNFCRILNMKEGYLERSFTCELPNGIKLEVKSTRFLSMVDTEIGAIRYSIKPVNSNASIQISSYLDADVHNEDSNYGEKFWDVIDVRGGEIFSYIISQTKKLDFQVGHAMRNLLFINGQPQNLKPQVNSGQMYVDNRFTVNASSGDEVILYKYAAVISNLNHEKGKFTKVLETLIEGASEKGFDKLFDEHRKAWADIWNHSDITIEGDVAAQQGIRFNIFQLSQTYTGRDERLNIGPKGFTGEKYGGSTYWDTEAYCLPFYMVTHGQKVARQLLLYRYKQLGKAIENAHKLGYTDGAALYPMVTMNGEECHNEWEITFEEIHRNGAIAFAIYNYVRYTGDKDYLVDFGLEVLIAIARFWSQRVNFSTEKGKYVMLGVTGPNEYENNVNNNWYTSTIACWCMEYAEEVSSYVKSTNNAKYQELCSRIGFDEVNEIARWKEIRSNIFLPEDKKLGIFLQQEGYLDKEQILVKNLDPKERPINQKWSWDRILRSCFIKQADVLQGLYFLEDRFDTETIKRNYEFYENRTVHESSLSPCVHSVLASRIGNVEKAYELYLRTARLDLDDYNNEVKEGLHITSMAGTWISIVEGFGGMRVRSNMLTFNPLIPQNWKSFSFKVWFRGNVLKIRVTNSELSLFNEVGSNITVKIYGKDQLIPEGGAITIAVQKQVY
ncbi:MAG TPA: family 65 glycosyl hydrolase domain-containing protein [Tenuifilaceae bacterium]|nr:family 65 glycosyl hydrolase domain-containing protein [Tenuifilaceae bacterium]HOC36053.1 family 65 glycosyl hydrolase domain-containing protein [Tenuifilaceae bacterium]HOG71885.1 family 65 glycosyl hydrolase domain-containing protein [Tenuifilaceae bacterium]HPG99802.1 family 65 glycosyl hydrolase domain-containing protein [Tenuifilaceae bacterium]HPS04471.1 family 65 glycosyl hydrolase domain-containing protein [Tenuifilaceae bacterium]